jgi:hypothetical protein
MKLQLGNPSACFEQLKNNCADFKDVKIEDVDFYMFPQWWESSALGFGGCGADAITTAYTVVALVQEKLQGAVFFDNRLAYVIKKYGTKFIDDIYKHDMFPKSEANKYEVPKRKKGIKEVY